MDALVQTVSNELRVSTIDLAAGFNVESRSVHQLAQKYMAEFLEMGKVFQQVGKKAVEEVKLGSISNGGIELTSISNVGMAKGGKGEKFAYFLNEDQATFLGTLTRNSEITVKFKLKLVMEFSKAKKQLQNLKAHTSTTEWLEARVDGKTARRAETDVIQAFIEYAKSQGSSNADNYYKSITKMQNAQLFCVAGKFRNLRDVMSKDQLFMIKIADMAVEKSLRDGIKAGKPYKDVFQSAKSAVMKIAEVVGKTDVVAKMLTQD